MHNKFTRDGPWDPVLCEPSVHAYKCMYIWVHNRKVSLTFISLPNVRGGGGVFSFIIFRFSSPSSRLSSSAVRRRVRRRTRPPSCAVSRCSLLFPRQRWSATHVCGWFSPLTWSNNVSEWFYYYFMHALSHIID